MASHGERNTMPNTRIYMCLQNKYNEHFVFTSFPVFQPFQHALLAFRISWTRKDNENKGIAHTHACT